MRTITMLLTLLVFVSAHSAEPAKGKFLLLDNEQLIEGEIVHEGEWYTIKRSVGEAQIPAHRVMALTETKLEAFMVLRRHANLRDVDERLRLARWGMMFDLKSHALEEAEAAVKLRPTNPEARNLVEGLKFAIASSATKPTTPVQSSATPTIETVVKELPTIPEFNQTAFSLFSSKVQPILMNGCARCHAGDQTGEFKLVRIYTPGSNRAGTMQNLFATLHQIDRANPSQSPVLVKAITPHGTPVFLGFRDANAPAYQILEAWVKEVSGLEDSAGHTKTAVKNVAKPSPVLAAEVFKPTQPTEKPNPSSFAEAKPKLIDPANDPFDPEIFNTQAGVKKPEKKPAKD
jgi:hypothetical protein